MVENVVPQTAVFSVDRLKKRNRIVPGGIVVAYGVVFRRRVVLEVTAHKEAEVTPEPGWEEQQREIEDGEQNCSLGSACNLGGAVVVEGEVPGKSEISWVAG